jgi:hypothetical protein
MYAIYGNIYHQYTPNVSICIPYMDPMGYIILIYYYYYKLVYHDYHYTITSIYMSMSDNGGMPLNRYSYRENDYNPMDLP